MTLFSLNYNILFTHAQPLFEQFIDTEAFRSENVNASLINTGNGKPNDSTILFSDLVKISVD